MKPTQIKSKSPRRAEASIDHFFCFACDEYVWDRDHLIEERIAFGKNDIAPAGQIIPKHAWVSGVVRMEPNKTHSIYSGKSTAVPFASRRWSRYRKSSHRTRRDATSDETHEEIHGLRLDFAPYESIIGVGHHSVWNGRFGRRFCPNEARVRAVHLEGGRSCTGCDICIATSAQWQGISHRRNGHPWCNRRVFVRTKGFCIIQTDPLEVSPLLGSR